MAAHLHIDISKQMPVFIASCTFKKVWVFCLFVCFSFSLISAKS